MSDQPLRMPSYPIDRLFIDRWSPRAFDGSPIDMELLMTLFEAARWAPSAFNVQPWRFIYALRDTVEWDRFVATLVPFNQDWAAGAAALVYIASDRFTRDADGKATGEAYSHSFDSGAAWCQLALQAVRCGLSTHCMTGFDQGAARAMLALPEDYRIEAAVAIGRLGNPDSLPEKLRSREVPSSRRPIEALVHRATFGGEAADRKGAVG